MRRIQQDLDLEEMLLSSGQAEDDDDDPARAGSDAGDNRQTPETTK